MMTLLFATCASLFAIGPTRQEPPLLEYTFATGEQGWTVYQPQGEKAKVGLIHDPSHVKVGSASLKYTYNIAVGELSLALVPVTDGAAANMKSISFWVLSDHAAGIAVTLQEKDGGRYATVFYAPKDKWQEVKLSVNDFNLTTDVNDPKDPNGKLDTDKIESVSITDFDQFLVQTPALASALQISEGPRMLCLSDVKIAKTDVGDAMSTTGDTIKVDNFEHPQISWLGLGVTGMSTSTDGPLSEKTLRADYAVGPGRVAGVIRPFRSGNFAGVKTIAIRWATAKAGTYILQVEEDGGAKYNRMLTMDGGSKATDNALALSSFTLSEDSMDSNGKLDPERIHHFAVIDVSGVAGGTEQANTVWIGSIVAKR